MWGPRAGRPRGTGREATADCPGHLLLSFCGWFKNILVKIHSHQALPLLQLRQLEADDLVNAVVDGPVELLGLVAGQHQHEPVPTDRGLRAEGLLNQVLTSWGAGLKPTQGSFLADSIYLAAL